VTNQSDIHKSIKSRNCTFYHCFYKLLLKTNHGNQVQSNLCTLFS